MDAETLTKLKDFVNAANNSGQINYDWGCQIASVKDDHILVEFFSTDEDDDLSRVGKLSVHSDTLMAWQEGDDEPIIFSNRPWILVSITYAGP